MLRIGLNAVADIHTHCADCEHQRLPKQVSNLKDNSTAIQKTHPL